MNSTELRFQPTRSTGNVRSHGKGFSLLELLVVIAVIIMLVALTTLAIGSLGPGRKLTAAGNLTVDLINHARQVARAKNTLTMVAMIESGADAGRAFTTMAYSATNGTNGNWTQIDQWRLLPEGMIIDRASSTNFFSALPPAATNIMRAGKAVSCTGAIFLPDGRPLSSATAPQALYLKYMTATEAAPTLKNYYKIIVNQSTGIPIIRRP